MDTIREYVESVFAQLPRTSDMERLKEEILANMEEKYTELTAQGVPENEAIGTVLTEFGNIDEIIDEYGYEKDVVYDEDTLLLTDEEADAFFVSPSPGSRPASPAECFSASWLRRRCCCFNRCPRPSLSSGNGRKR